MSGPGVGSWTLAARMDSAARGGASPVLLGPEDDLAVDMAAFEFGAGPAGVHRRGKVHDRCPRGSVGAQAGQLGAYSHVCRLTGKGASPDSGDCRRAYSIRSISGFAVRSKSAVHRSPCSPRGEFGPRVRLNDLWSRAPADQGVTSF